MGNLSVPEDSKTDALAEGMHPTSLVAPRAFLDELFR